MKYEDYVMEICYFLKKLVADEYRLKVSFDESLGTDNEANIIVDTTYLNTKVNIARMVRKYFTQKKYADVLAVLSHEFAHILTEPLYDLAIEDSAPSKKELADKIRERQTERIGRVLALLVPENLWNLEERKNADKK